MNRRNNLTPWYVQSRRIFTIDGPFMELYAGQGGGRGYVIYETYESLLCGERTTSSDEHERDVQHAGLHA